MVMGYSAAQIDREGVKINMGRYLYDAASQAFEDIRTGNF